MSRRRRIPLVTNILRRMRHLLSDQLADLEGEPRDDPEPSFRGTATRRHRRADRRDEQRSSILPYA